MRIFDFEDQIISTLYKVFRDEVSVLGNCKSSCMEHGIINAKVSHIKFSDYKTIKLFAIMCAVRSHVNSRILAYEIYDGRLNVGHSSSTAKLPCQNGLGRFHTALRKSRLYVCPGRGDIKWYHHDPNGHSTMEFLWKNTGLSKSVMVR